MPLVSTPDLVEALRQSRLLEPDQMEEISNRLQPRFPEPRALAKELLNRDWLTPYQVNQLFLGRGQDLVLGQYVLLERLGEGGMGQVFKARHRTMGRVVALKIIRKERLDKPEVVRRFHREVRAAAQLKHPNVVLAFDADEINHTHFFAMEYVDGIDLSRLVKTRGPLAIDQACDFVCQAARGLQHAHECGLVHRDIKPANLFVTRLPGLSGGPSANRPRPVPALVADASGSISAVNQGPQVKILDMGLARLHPAMQEEGTPGVTQEGVVLGTVDFLAPEQAVNASNVDIRADIYGLGCTFYYLLTGQVPFAGTTAMEKLLKHRCDDPVPLEQLRPEVPSAVAAVVHKMMAKRPEDRFQSPTEVVLALSRIAGSNVSAQALAPTTGGAGPIPAAIPLPGGGAPLTAPQTMPALDILETPLAPAAVANSAPETGGIWETLTDWRSADTPDVGATRGRRIERPWLQRFGPALLLGVLGALCLAGMIFFIVHLLRPDESPPRRTTKLPDDKPPTQTHRPKPLEKEILNTVGMRLMLVPAGRFGMGSPRTEPSRQNDEGPVHPVEITQPFYIGVFEVSQAWYRAVMNDNPAYFQRKFLSHRGDVDHPVERVTWDEAREFCRRLSELPAEKAAGRVYRLPTEAEWEYACRAQMDKAVALGRGDSLSARQANFRGDMPYGSAPRLASSGRTVPGGSYHLNRWGLCDMHGNVWEWCADYYQADYYQASPAQDPPGPSKGTLRVIRGGSWADAGTDCRCARRRGVPANTRSPQIGFRVVMTLAAKK
jgi:serine/threonine-protein kinase